MSFSVTDAFVQQFTGNVQHLAQQRTSRLRGKVSEDTITGEAAYLEQMAPTTARKSNSRHGDTPIMNTQHLRRRVAPYDYDWGDLVDKPDKARLLIDPASEYAIAAAAALNRGVDDEIIAAFFAIAYTGHAGATSVTWPNGNAESVPTTPAGKQVAVNAWNYGNGSGNAGLTISKLIEAKVALDAAEGEEEEERYIALKSVQLGNLLATTEATSGDYNTVLALVQGKIAQFMGFTFLHSERLLTDANGYTRVPAWRKNGMGLGVLSDITGRMAERPDKKFALQVFATMSVGASRLEEAKVAEISCA
jgi:hypothetical protein